VWVGLLMMILFFMSPRRTGLWSCFFGLALLGTSVLLPDFVRCSICGLRLQTSSAAQSVPWHWRQQWILSLQACPVCLDDGNATIESQERWLQSGSVNEQPYWSVARLAIAIGAILAVLGFAVAEGECLSRGHTVGERLSSIESVGETRAVRQLTRIVSGSQPLPSAPPLVPWHVRARPARGVLRRADPAQRADSTAPWSTHAVALLLRYLLACSAAAPSTLVLVTEHLPA
jgi:hypothetical protein